MTLTGTVDAANARIDLFVDFVPEAGVQTFATLYRRVGSPTAPTEYVRGLFGTTLLGEQAYVSDHEAPLDEPVWYLAVGQGGATVGMTAGPFTIPSNGYVWMKDPGRPWADLRLDLCEDPGPGAYTTCPATVPLRDTFTRTVAAGGWGTADTGQVWTVSGTATDYSVSGGTGRHDMLSAAVSRRSTVTQPQTDIDIRADIGVTQIPTVADVHAALMARIVDSNNMYVARLEVHPDATVWVSLARRTAGVVTVLAITQVAATYTPSQMWTVRLNLTGQVLRTRAWLAGTPEPTQWMLRVSDSSYTAAGTMGLRSERITGNTNAGLLVLYDNVEATTVTPPAPELAWVGFRDKVRAADAGLFDVLDREFPADVYARRKEVTSSWLFLTRTLDSINAVYQLYTTGGPILLQLAALYGTRYTGSVRPMDRYMQPGDLTESYISQDQRRPVRLWSAPVAAVPLPIGLPQGTDTANWCALGDSYGTYADLTASGYTWGQVATGQASTAPTSGLYGGGTYGGGIYGG